MAELIPPPRSLGSLEWKRVFELQHADRVDEAFALARKAGLGSFGDFMDSFRMVEAEGGTRTRSTLRTLTDDLSLEVVQEELPFSLDELMSLITVATRSVLDMLNVQKHNPTLLTILSREYDGPWIPDPHGYFESRAPYEKICLPAYLLDDVAELDSAIRHEFAHVVVATTTDGRASSWVHEGVATFCANELELDARLEFASGKSPWVRPDELNLLFAQDVREVHEKSLWAAYQQAGWIVHTLSASFGADKLFQFLTEHKEERMLSMAFAQLLQRSDTQRALRSVYGMREPQLFAFVLRELQKGV